jgi:hypothetical protein
MQRCWTDKMLRSLELPSAVSALVLAGCSWRQFRIRSQLPHLKPGQHFLGYAGTLLDWHDYFNADGTLFSLMGSQQSGHTA